MRIPRIHLGMIVAVTAASFFSPNAVAQDCPTCGSICQWDCDFYWVDLKLEYDWQYEDSVWMISGAVPAFASAVCQSQTIDGRPIVCEPDESCTDRDCTACVFFDSDAQSSVDLELFDIIFNTRSVAGFGHAGVNACIGLPAIAEASVNMGRVSSRPGIDGRLSASGSFTDDDWTIPHHHGGGICEVLVHEYIDINRASVSGTADWDFVSSGPALLPPILKIRHTPTGEYIFTNSLDVSCVDFCSNIDGENIPVIPPDSFRDGIVIFFSVLVNITFTDDSVQTTEHVQGVVGFRSDGTLVKLGALDDPSVIAVDLGSLIEIQSPTLEYEIPMPSANIESVSMTAIVETSAQPDADLGQDGNVCWSDRVVLASLIGTSIGDGVYDVVADLNLDGSINALDMGIFNQDCSGLDCDCDGDLDSDDFFCFLDKWSASDVSADVDGDADVDSDDYFLFLDLYSNCL